MGCEQEGKPAEAFQRSTATIDESFLKWIILHLGLGGSFAAFSDPNLRYAMTEKHETVNRKR